MRVKSKSDKPHIKPASKINIAVTNIKIGTGRCTEQDLENFKASPLVIEKTETAKKILGIAAHK